MFLQGVASRYLHVPVGHAAPPPQLPPEHPAAP